MDDNAEQKGIRDVEIVVRRWRHVFLFAAIACLTAAAAPRLANDSAVVCLWGGATLKPGEKGVVIRGNKVVLSPESPLRRLWTTKARLKELVRPQGDANIALPFH